MSLANSGKSATEVAACLEGKKRLHFIGIGGVHMSALAQYAMQTGFLVSGSDRVESNAVERLRRAGATVTIGHKKEALGACDAVIYTLAIEADNPEYVAASERGLPLISRADYLGYILSFYPHRIGVSGSHGKSTVTAMLAEILFAAGRSPTVFCGAAMRRFGGGLLMGEGEEVVFEACEYEDSFLSFSPTLAVILNVELDHVDYFASTEAVVGSFARFAARAGEKGAVLYGAESENAARAASACGGARHTFGVGRGDFFARDLRFDAGCAVFTPVLGGESAPMVRLSVAGEHNVANALAAAGAAYLCGVAPAVISAALSSFRGVGRRLEYRGRLCGAPIYDDYAHHPAEIAASLRAARALAGGGRLFAVFQSHTYSRTAAFFDEIAAALRLADRVIVAPIYAARERDTRGMSAERLAAHVGDRATAGRERRDLAACLLREVTPGDLVVVMGAGDIDRLFGEFSAKDFTPCRK